MTSKRTQPGSFPTEPRASSSISATNLSLNPGLMSMVTTRTYIMPPFSSAQPGQGRGLSALHLRDGRGLLQYVLRAPIDRRVHHRTVHAHGCRSVPQSRLEGL